MANRLVRETSPYLLQHAENPVDWYPWGEEALARAKQEDKPILLSIGYSACHWCHVMEHESFENPDIARIMNEHFVSIKVDREERPDLDSIYMAAVQAMTQRGGWPMTVFLTPAGAPFYCGTYFPPEDRMGMPGFPRVLQGVAKAYADRREEVEQSGQRLVEHLRESARLSAAAEEDLNPELLPAAARGLSGQFDQVEGGFGGAPKFPQPMAIEFLLRFYVRAKDPSVLRMVELTLGKMARGGMYDQLGGGFHRYSVDGQWLVPHFEKMLYDNAQLALAYLHGFQLTGKAFYRQIAEATLDYVVREMTSPEGGFYSTQDADSEGEEGKFFVWTPAEIVAVLGDDDARLFMRYFDVTESGNFEGKNILHVPREADVVADQLGVDVHEFEATIQSGRQKLLAAREQRVHPGRDEKVLTSWNGLMLKAFAEASAILTRPDYADVARRNAGFVLGKLRREGKLLRTYKDGQSKLNGYLEDYANLIDGLLALYQVSFELPWFQAARELTDTMLEQFWDGQERCFYDTGRDHEQLINRPRDAYDNATPSGSSVAVDVLLRMWLLTGEQRCAAVAEAVLRAMQRVAASYPLGFARLLCAYDLHFGPAREIALVGGLDSPELSGFRQAIWSRFVPNKVVAACAPGDAKARAAIPLLKGREPVDGHPAAYVCHSFACEMPVTEPAKLLEQLSS
ncbi:MAG TPA: thioredoxin domain-containing protein [Chloroflexota bacterium]|nr:thioredoxin domain-containing protein [Chloroflexota bacterium]